MPTTKYKIVKKGNQFCVADKDTDMPIHGGKGSCHANRPDAVKQLRAIYANSGKSFNEKCLHVPTKSFSDLSEVKDRKHWIQIFPFGHWPHPVFTDTTVNKDTAEQYVKNFHDKVRRQDIMTDYDHGEDKAKGNKASGQYLDMEVREDGVYALVEWTENAFSEIQNKEWKYFSPLFLDVWDDAETGETFENVIIGGGLTNRPYMKDMVPINFSEAVLEEETTKFRFKDGKWIASDNNGESWRNATEAEHADLEHSEPGTGNPPAPREDEDDKSGDKDGQGIRRDPLPVENTKEGSEVELTPETLVALGLKEDADDATINSEILELVKTVEPLKKFHEENKKAKQFAEEYPDEAARMKKLQEAEDKRIAKEFSERYQRITKMVGEGDEAKTIPTTKGFSALVLTEIEGMAKKFHDGTGTIEDVQKVLDTISTDKAIVDYGEAGSSRTPEENEIPTETLQVRKQFAEKVMEIQTREGGPDKCSWGDAVAKAFSEHPQLAEAYNNSGTPQE